MSLAGEVRDRTEVSCGAKSVLCSATQESSLYPICGRDLVEILHGSEVDAGVADIRQFHGGVLSQFLFDADVPLPAVRRHTAWVFCGVRGNLRVGKRGRCIQRTNRRRVDYKRSGAGKTFIHANEFALEELTAAEAHSRFAVAEHVPRDTNARRDVVIVLVDE